MRALSARFAAAVFAVLVATTAYAQPCVGFTDVDISNGFCPSVEWIRNRGVTLGCSASQYCPGDNVTRLQMAAFMQRLGGALTPRYLTALDTATGDLGNNGVRVCITGDQAINGYPRNAVIDGLVTVSASATDQAFVAAAVHSTNGGLNWNVASLASPFARVSSSPAHDRVSVPLVGLVPMNVGSAYRFSVFVSWVGGTAGTATVSCSLRIRLESRDGTTSPLDE